MKINNNLKAPIKWATKVDSAITRYFEMIKSISSVEELVKDLPKKINLSKGREAFEGSLPRITKEASSYFNEKQRIQELFRGFDIEPLAFIPEFLAYTHRYVNWRVELPTTELHSPKIVVSAISELLVKEKLKTGIRHEKAIRKRLIGGIRNMGGIENQDQEEILHIQIPKSFLDMIAVCDKLGIKTSIRFSPENIRFKRYLPKKYEPNFSGIGEEIVLVAEIPFEKENSGNRVDEMVVILDQVPGTDSYNQMEGINFLFPENTPLNYLFSVDANISNWLYSEGFRKEYPFGIIKKASKNRKRK